MRHIPFLKALAKAKDSADPVWRDAAPGYLVLRFLDRWLEEGSATIVADQSLMSLKQRIRGVGATVPEVRKMLLHTIDALIETDGQNPTTAAPHLLSYADYLRSSGLAALGAHTFKSVAEALQQAEAFDDPQLVVALLKYGYTTIQLGDFAAAQLAFEQGEYWAAQQGDMEQVWRAMIGRGSILRTRGNLPAAEDLLSTVITQAEAAAMPAAIGRGYWARAGVLQFRKRYDDAMRDYYQAYEMLSGVERESVLGDLASCESEAGYLSAARDTNQLLAFTAQFPIVRSTALINLIQLAVDERNEDEFNRARLNLTAYEQRYKLSVEHSAHAALYIAMGIERFGSPERAIEAYRAAAIHARSLGIHQVEFEAEEKIANLLEIETHSTAATSTVVVPAASKPPDELRYITDTIAAAASSALVTLGL